MAIKVAVNGALGNMGREVLKAVYNERDLQLVAATDIKGDGSDAGTAVGLGKIGIPTGNNLKEALAGARPDVVVDFTSPYSVLENIEIIMAAKARPVVGTSGITEADLEKIGAWSRQHGVAALIAPNFAVGAVLMMQFAALAARYLPSAEIIDLHHDKKIDSPSGTAIKAAEMISKARGTVIRQTGDEMEKLAGARGARLDDIPIHSVRLPGLMAHHEIIFGGLGQTLSIRHDSHNRSSFIPGVILAIKEIMSLKGVVYGLENILKQP